MILLPTIDVAGVFDALGLAEETERDSILGGADHGIAISLERALIFNIL